MMNHSNTYRSLDSINLIYDNWCNSRSFKRPACECASRSPSETRSLVCWFLEWAIPHELRRVLRQLVYLSSFSYKRGNDVTFSGCSYFLKFKFTDRGSLPDNRGGSVAMYVGRFLDDGSRSMAGRERDERDESVGNLCGICSLYRCEVSSWCGAFCSSKHPIFPAVQKIEPWSHSNRGNISKQMMKLDQL